MKLIQKSAAFVLPFFILNSLMIQPVSFAAVSPGQEQQRIKMEDERRAISSQIEAAEKEPTIEVGEQNVAVTAKTDEVVQKSTGDLSSPGYEPVSYLSESSEEVKFVIKEIRIPENAPVSKYEMEALIQTFEGKEVKLTEVIYLTDNIAQLYSSARLISKLNIIKEGFDDEDNDEAESPTSFVIDKITVPDNAAISQDEVESLVKPYEGKELTLNELRSFSKNLDKIYLSSENINAIAEGEYQPMGGAMISGAGTSNIAQRRAAKKAQRAQEAALPTEDVAFLIEKIEFAGNTVIPSAEIEAITSPHRGKTMKLADAKNIALSITQLYRAKGYITCRAYIPPQKLTDKVLKIQIFEGKLGKVKVQGNRYFSNKTLKKYVNKLKGKVLQYSDLSRNIKRTNQNPDHEVKAVIVPGKTVGTSDLILDVRETFPLHINAEVNNYGTKLTGRERYNVSVRHTNVTGHDDIFATRVQFGDHVFAVGTQYAVPVGEYDTQVGASFNYTDVDIAGPFTVLDLGGEAYSGSVFLNQPLWSNDWIGFTWTNSLEYKDVENTVLGATSSKDKLRMVHTGLNIDEVDRWGRTFITNDFTFGTPWFDASDKNDPLLSREQAGADFFKYSVAANRIHPVHDSTYLLFKAAAQMSPDRLVSAEQFDLGGVYSVRGYPQSDYLGDSGVSGSAELRVPFYFIPRDVNVPWTQEPLWNKINFVGFVDGGYAGLKAHVVGEDGSRSAWGAGGGLRFDLPRNLTGRFEYAWPIGDEPTDRSNGQFYFSVSGDLF